MADNRPQDAMNPALAARLHLALTASEDVLYDIVRDPSVDVLLAALKNPGLAPDHLKVLLRRTDLTEQIILAVSRTKLYEEHHGVRALVFRNAATPSHIAVSMVPQLHLFELVDAVLLATIPPDHRIAAERAVVQRLPSVPLGNRITLARRATATILEALLADGDSRLMEACLANPRLSEGSIARLLNGANATAEVISAIARHDRWKARPGVRRAILRNSRTPLIWFTLWLPSLPVTELRDLAISTRLDLPRKRLVQEALEKRTGAVRKQKKA